jgi:hypothetical protein
MNKLDGVICPFCREWHTRTLTGHQGTNTIYLDENGERWSGNRCPPCAKAHKLAYDKKRRAKLGHKPLGSEAPCSLGCGNVVKVERGSHRTCESCRKDTKK